MLLTCEFGICLEERPQIDQVHVIIYILLLSLEC